MIKIDPSLCVGCAMCVAACGEDAIECIDVAVLHVGKCTECLDCLDFCPTKAIVFFDPVQEKEKRIAIASLMEKHAKFKS